MDKDKSKKQNSIDDVMKVEFDLQNKETLYQKIQEELKSNAQDMSQSKLAEQIQKYREDYRNYYYVSNIMENRSHDFFEDVIKDINPSMKIKKQSKNILKMVCKVFLQELAEKCVQVIQNNPVKEDIDVQVVNYAYHMLKQSKPRTSVPNSIAKGLK